MRCLAGSSMGFINNSKGGGSIMKRIFVLMLSLSLSVNMSMVAGCKKAEEPVKSPVPPLKQEATEKQVPESVSKQEKAEQTAPPFIPAPAPIPEKKPVKEHSSASAPTQRQKAVKKQTMEIASKKDVNEKSALFAAQSTITESEGYACMGEDKSMKETEQTAIADAKRKAIEYVLTYVKSETKVKNFQLEKDLTSAYANAVVKVLQEIGQGWYKDPALGECYKIRIKAEVVPDENAMKKVSSKMETGEKAKQATAAIPAPAPVQPTPKKSGEAIIAKKTVASLAFDGLIIDARAHNFRPEMINRIFSLDGRSIYDCSKMSKKVLVEHGCGEYTDSVDKAKALLAERGVKNPLIIKAVGISSPKDLLVSEEDTEKILSADKNAGFLENVKIGFVFIWEKDKKLW